MGKWGHQDNFRHVNFFLQKDSIRTKSTKSTKKHQTQTNDFYLLSFCICKKTMPLFFCLLIFVLLVCFWLTVFVCMESSCNNNKKINRSKIVLMTSFIHTTSTKRKYKFFFFCNILLQSQDKNGVSSSTSFPNVLYDIKHVHILMKNTTALKLIIFKN